MSEQNFTDTEWLIQTIADYLTKAGFAFNDENSDPENIAIQFNFTDELSKLGILIGQQKSSLYHVDVVSTVNFSPIHVDVLTRITPEDKQKLIDSIFFWSMPREPNYLLQLDPIEEPKRDPFYLVVSPIFEGDLSLTSLMKAIDKVIKSSSIIRRLIQQHLHKYVVTKPPEGDESVVEKPEA